MDDTIPFHEAAVERLEKVSLFDGAIIDLNGDRSVEVWKIKEVPGFCIRVFRKTKDGKTSALKFGLTPDAAAALWTCLGSALKSTTGK